MNIILDYNVGNLDSVTRAFERVGIPTKISNNPMDIKQCTSLILPGVGAFEEAMKSLTELGLIPLIRDHVNQGKYLLGICLGMQLLYDRSYENGEFKGLGILNGTIDYLNLDLKVPHMGWNNLKFKKPNDPFLKYIKEDDYVYFVHSYFVNSTGEELVAYAEYGIPIPAIVSQGNIYATQFHPEKSGQVGLNLLKAYGEMIK